jgi:hypothetical protein
MRALLLLVLAGCFVPHDAAGRHCALVKNAWMIAGGLAVSALGYGALRSMGGDDEPPEPLIVGSLLLLVTGGVMTVGGLAGAGATELGLTSVQ